jgi:membrane-associated phospholipid phosphatase
MMSTGTMPNVMAERASSRERGAAIAWLGVYLAGSAGLLVAFGTSAADSALVAVHVLLLAVFALSYGARSGALAAVGDLGPLVVAPLLYMELGRIIAVVGMPFHDALVQGWEGALFHSQPAHVLAAALPYVAVSEALHAGYLAYYLAIFVPALWLYTVRDWRAFHVTVLGVVVTCTVCWALYVLFPVQGPRYLWAAPLAVPDGPFRELATRILASGSSRGAAFPSSHMAVMTVETVVAWRWHHRAMFGALCVVSLLVGVGAVYGGFHYAVDMVSGAVLGLAIGGGVLVACSRASPS